MTSSAPRRRLGAYLVPLIIALGALPLMAPTCGSSGEGVRVFARRSLIIPMDVCYQYTTDQVNTSYTPSGGTTECPTKDPGDVIKAYGLVYQLIRAGVAVYWVIDQNKSTVDGVDLQVQYDGGIPVYLFNWSTGVEGAAPAIGNGGHIIHYRGGPFVVDGSDFARAAAVLQSFSATFGSVNVHVANVAFQGYSKRTMAGGWSAGGAIPPKLALLDIGSDGAGAKNSEVVIQGYLTRAGLDTAGAAGTATGTHGEIYDRLFMPDFLGAPTVTDWTTSALYKNKYQILWVPHWAAPSSCSDCPPGTSCTCNNKYPAATISAALTNMGSFVTQPNLNGARGDMFAECAGLGSFEGVFSGADPSATGANSVYGTGVASTHYQTENTTGVWINKSTSSAYFFPTSAGLGNNFASPLMQLGDYPFIPQTGAIQNYKANDYKAETVRLISENTSPKDTSGVPTYDVFTVVPGIPASHGTIVYLGGHSYSGTDGKFEVAGARLVLNTLFNLGSSCTEGGVCATGLAGVCSTGHYKCLGGPDPTCVPDIQPGQLTEICNGLDDDCDGQVDEGLQTACYTGPAGTEGVGPCSPGMQVCQRNPDGTYSMSACTGQVLPVAESCNGVDDDCDGVVDDNLPSIACYDGPPGTQDVGVCHGGTQLCQSGAYGAVVGGVFTPGACAGEVVPGPEICSDSGPGLTAQDDDCDGQVNNGCTCSPGVTPDQSCFTGPGAVNVGTCHAGTQTCLAAPGGGAWSGCNGQVTAQSEACVPGAIYDAPGFDPLGADSIYDVNCDGHVTRCPDCTPGVTPPRACAPSDPSLPPLPAGSSWTQGQCSPGTQTCGADGKWSACSGYIMPSVDLEGITIEYCDNKDNNCNGTIDENASCPQGTTCLRGVCVPSVCGTERPPPEGYACDTSGGGGTGTVVSGSCGATPAPGCDPGEVCQYGTCADPCPVNSTTGASKVCGQNTVCGGGACIGGSCYEAGCLAGELCLGGTCKTDPCAGKFCPSGTFCRQGDCVQACTFMTCAAGSKCGIDGFCEPDPCAGKTCSAGQKCTNGVCAADPCLGMGCATGQICVANGTTPTCVDDPCTGVVCPVGKCASGQCYPSGNLTGAGTGTTQSSSSGGGCGCGSGTGVAFPALLALLAAPILRRRRRSQGGGGGLVLLLAAVVLVASACKDTKTETHFDPSTCPSPETCGEQHCVDIKSDPSHCGTDPATACAHVCAPGNICVDGTCGPTTQVAPYIRSVTPSSGAKDGIVSLTIFGDRFQADATLRYGSTTPPTPPPTVPCPDAATNPCPTPTSCPIPWCRWSSGALSVVFDLTGAAPAQPWTLRVANPGDVISNAVKFGIVVPTPSLAGVAPSTVPTGTKTTLVVSGTGQPGTGFTSDSTCLLNGPGLVPPGRSLTPAVLAGANQLECPLDATDLQANVYSLTVKSETGVVSNALQLTVAPSAPVVLSVAPDHGDPGVVTTLLVTGTRFDPATAAVLFYNSATGQASPLAVIPAANVTVLDSSATVRGWPLPTTAGPYSVAVRTGTAPSYRYSNAVPFAVGAAATFKITSFQPSTAYQGDPGVVLTFTGTAIPPNSQIELQPPQGGSFTPLPTTVSGCVGSACTTLSATKSLIQSPGVPEPEGQWMAQVRAGTQAGDPVSAPWPLRVLSNQAILRDYSSVPDPQQAGTVGGAKTSLAFQVSNIHGVGTDFSGVKVVFMDPSGATSLLTPNPLPNATTTVLTVPGTPGSPALSLAGRDIGTYLFKIWNPNSTPSNPLPFGVTAGFPSVSSACLVPVPPSGCAVPLVGGCCPGASRGSATSLTIRVFGTNFAKPDASGNASAVAYAADIPGTPPVDPCNPATFQPLAATVTVDSPTQMTVTFDPRDAIVSTGGTTYYVGVWNPGLNGLQKSTCGVPFKLLP